MNIYCSGPTSTIRESIPPPGIKLPAKKLACEERPYQHGKGHELPAKPREKSERNYERHRGVDRQYPLQGELSDRCSPIAEREVEDEDD